MPFLVPVMIRTFGRTGSTLLMQILGTDKRVCFERLYPFEQRYLTYAYNMARMIGETPKASSTDWNNDVLFQCRAASIGSLPYGRIKAFDREELARRCFVSLWEQFSQAMREHQQLTPDQLAYYAEKVPNQVADHANKYLNARNIFLLRDPRDEMVSIRSFNQKRGFQSFGWLDSDSDISYARKICRNRKQFLHNLLSFDTSHRRIFVRYEDLIKNGEGEVARLSKWLGLPLSMKKATRDKGIQKKHMTSENPGLSVERWKTELSEEVLDIFRAEIGTELKELGYTL